MIRMPDAGCVYDTVRCLAVRAVEPMGIEGSDNPCYMKISKRLDGICFPLNRMLLSFLCAIGTGRSLLHSLAVTSVEIDACTKTHTLQVMNNKGYMERRFTEWFFPDKGSRSLLKVLRGSDGLELLAGYHMEPAWALNVYHTAIHLDAAVAELIRTFELVYAEVEREQRDYLASAPDFFPTDDSPAAEKLFAAGKTGDFSAGKTCVALSLMDPSLVDIWPGKRAGIILGCDYAKTLEEKEYRYINIKPWHLAMAIGNESKNAIFEALARTPAMTRSQMEQELHLSRAALDHNLKEMRAIGLVIADGSQSRYMYRLDREFVMAAGYALVSIAGGSG